MARMNPSLSVVSLRVSIKALRHPAEYPSSPALLLYV